jgi:hypothetical protein
MILGSTGCQPVVAGNPAGNIFACTMAKDGSLLISEDGNGTIWRVSYSRQPTVRCAPRIGQKQLLVAVSRIICCKA